MARVFLGTEHRRFTDGVAEVDVEAATVKELIAKLDAQFPGLGKELEGNAVAINGEVIAYAKYERVPEGAEIYFVVASSGG